MPTFAWKDLLTQWSQDIIAVEEHAEELPPEVIKVGWLGYSPASEAEIIAAEKRLGVQFPPSYRQFLAVSNGWRMTTPFINNVCNTDEVDWLATHHQDLIDAWRAFDKPVSDEDYFIYDDQNDQPLRAAYLSSALAVSEFDDGIYLLNPKVVNDQGEWEAWFFADWLPGAQRYPSFWDLMQAEHQNFLNEAQGDAASEDLSLANLDFDPTNLGSLFDMFQSPATQQQVQGLLNTGNLDEAETFEEILAILQDPEQPFTVRQNAARKLGDLGDPRAVQPLIDTFREKPQNVNDMKLSALLGDMGDMPGGPLLRGMFENMNVGDILQQAQSMLGGMLGGEDMGGQLGALLNPETMQDAVGQQTHQTTLESLLKLGEAAQPALIAALKDPDEQVRYWAINTLSHNLDTPAVYDALLPTLTDPDPEVRRLAVEQLGEIASPRTVDILLPLLQDDLAEVRLETVLILGDIGLEIERERIIAALQPLAQDPAQIVREVVADALGELAEVDD